jgi:hypothetical protein
MPFGHNSATSPKDGASRECQLAELPAQAIVIVHA